MAMVFAADGLNGSETLLLLGYTNYTDPHGYCWPSEKRLADDCGISVSTVARTKRALVGRSLVKSVRRVNPKTGEPISNLTRVNLPLLASMKRKSKHYDDDVIGEITFEESDEAFEGADGDAPVKDETGPDLLTSQSDSYPPSDCYVPPVNMTGTPLQSDSQSTIDPSVDPSVIPNAPSARSAPDARRASTGSKGSSSSGFAASEQAAPRLTREQKQQVQAVRDLLPPDLNRALPVRTPRNIADSILKALAAGLPRERTPQQLVEFRVMARWNGYWAARFYAGELGRAPFGPLAAMVEDTQECGSGSCEDRVDIFTAEACSSCEQRAVNRRADREQPRQHPPVSEATSTVPKQTVMPMQCCDECGRGFRAPEPGLCRECEAVLVPTQEETTV